MCDSISGLSSVRLLQPVWLGRELLLTPLSSQVLFYLRVWASYELLLFSPALWTPGSKKEKDIFLASRFQEG